MPLRSARLCLALLLFLVSFSACSGGQGQQVAATMAQPTSVVTSAPPPQPSVPAATIPPAPSPTSAPTSAPTATAPPPPTPDPWAQYAPYTIEALRQRSYGAEGQIEIVRVMERTAN